MTDPKQVILNAAMKRKWAIQPVWALAHRLNITNRPDAALLSVYRDHGVVLKASRDDNFNKPGEDLTAYRWVEPGNLVLNKMKTWQGSLGVSEYSGIVSPAYYVCSLSETLHPRYAHYLLRSDPYIALYRAYSKGIRPNQWDLPFDEFRSLPFLLPSPVEQRRIAEFLDDQVAVIDRVLALRRQQLELLSERRLETIRNGVAGALLEQVPCSVPGVAFVGPTAELRPCRASAPFSEEST